jgi:predicted alpha/beta superfamily hydrolase
VTLRALPLLLVTTVALLCTSCSDSATTTSDASPGEATTCPPTDATSCPSTPPAPNLTLFSKLEADLKQLSGPAARKARVDTFLADVAASGLYPLREASTVVFLYRGTPPGAPSVVGSFNGWKPGADSMNTFPDTDLYYLEKSLGQARQEYKLAIGADRIKDPLNEHVVWDGLPKSRKLSSVIPPQNGVDPGGELRWHRVESKQLNNTRDVFVYLPPAYLTESCATYPVLLINDGNASLTQAHFDAVAKRAFAACKASPVLLVFVALADWPDRDAEYSCMTSAKGPTYADFLCDTLVPLIDKRYRTVGTADARGIIGASLGGLSAYAAAFWRSDCFHRVGAQDGSFWSPRDNGNQATYAMVKRVQSTAKLPITRAYLDNGKDNRDGTLMLRDALRVKGYAVHHWEDQSHLHDFIHFGERFDEALGYLFPP